MQDNCTADICCTIFLNGYENIAMGSADTGGRYIITDAVLKVQCF